MGLFEGVDVYGRVDDGCGCGCGWLMVGSEVEVIDFVYPIIIILSFFSLVASMA
jgi:hypothetical protein